MRRVRIAPVRIPGGVEFEQGSRPTQETGTTVSSTHDSTVTSRLLRIWTGTWNVHGIDVTKERQNGELTNMRPWLVEAGSCDVVCVGTQECQRSIRGSFFKLSKRRWEKHLLRELRAVSYERGRTDDELHQVASVTLVAIHLSVFVRRSLLPFLAAVHTGTVATGALHKPHEKGVKLGNKGAVYCALHLCGTRFLVLNSHLHAHHGAKHVRRRNAECYAIMRQLRVPENFFRAESPRRSRVTVSRISVLRGGSKKVHPVNDTVSTSVVMERFDAVIWTGDLNYRINGNRGAVDHLIERGMMEVLRANDQLSHQREHGLAFTSFQEGPLSFAPTYKFDPDSDTYDSSSKRRVPGWTDRVLYRNKSDALPVLKLLQYTSVPSIRVSDHRPVYATFEATCHVPHIACKDTFRLEARLHRSLWRRACCCCCESTSAVAVE